MTTFVKRDDCYIFLGSVSPKFGGIALSLNTDFVKIFTTKHSRFDR